MTRADAPSEAVTDTGRLGPNYVKLWTASVVSNLGDGVSSAALPLLAETLTRDPLLFAGVAVANRLPWLAFSLHAGAIVDRLDRRRLMVGANAVRFGLMGLLGVAVLGGFDSIWLLYVIAFGLGVAEVLFDNAAQTIMPAVVHRELLERANGRLFAGEIVTNQFAGPPLGGILFALAAAVPILLDAGTFLVSAGLIFWMSGSYVRRRRHITALDVAAAPERVPDAGEMAAAPAAAAGSSAAGPQARPPMRHEIREGIAWLWRHRLLRMLALLLAVMNGTSMMGFAVFALFAVGPESVLGLGPVGFSVLLTAGAVGSVVGSLGARRIVDAFGRGPALWATLVASVAIPAVIGLTSQVWLVAVASTLFGLTAVVWNVITVSLRQTIIPDELLGRVNSVYRFFGWGAMPLGSLLGGAIAAGFGLRAPWLAAAGITAAALLPAVRVIRSPTIEAARAAAAAGM